MGLPALHLDHKSGLESRVMIGCRNLCRRADVLLTGWRMDDKTLNLWRQIEDFRRRGKKRALPGAGDRSAKPNGNGA